VRAALLPRSAEPPPTWAVRGRSSSGGLTSAHWRGILQPTEGVRRHGAWSSRDSGKSRAIQAGAGVRENSAAVRANDDLDLIAFPAGRPDAGSSGERTARLFPKTADSPAWKCLPYNGMVLGHGLCHGTAWILPAVVDTRTLRPLQASDGGLLALQGATAADTGPEWQHRRCWRTSCGQRPRAHGTTSRPPDGLFQERSILTNLTHKMAFLLLIFCC